jgi:Uma2 family endonuclease
MMDKYDLYGKRGVREYWVVDPGNRAVTLFRKDKSGRYGDGEVLVNTGTAASAVLEGFAVDLGELFREE